MKRRLLCGVLVLLAIASSKGYGQTDYLLEHLSISDNQQCEFVSPNCPIYSAGFWEDSMSMMCWRVPPVLKPGMVCSVLVRWKFWTSHVPVCYMNYFGDWNPNVELAQSSMYGGIPSPNEEFVDIFAFQVPSTPGWYRIRFMGRLSYSPQTSFYGSPTEFPVFFSEILFHSGYDVKVEEKEVFPSTYGVSQNFPNPARVRTTIQYQIPTESDVRITIYNTAGQVVRTLINGERIKAGNYNIVWDGRDNGGKEVSAGTYFYTLDVNGKTATKKAIIVE